MMQAYYRHMFYDMIDTPSPKYLTFFLAFLTTDVFQANKYHDKLLKSQENVRYLGLMPCAWI